jgi:uncharacterized membrane protein YukC
MDSIDISDLAFSLGNFSAVNELLSSTTEKISESISGSIPEFVSESIPEFVSESIPESISGSIPDISNTDNSFFLYLGIGLIIISIVGIFTYNYFINKNKNVRFQDNVENYQEPQSNYHESPTYQHSDF